MTVASLALSRGSCCRSILRTATLCANGGWLPSRQRGWLCLRRVSWLREEVMRRDRFCPRIWSYACSPLWWRFSRSLGHLRYQQIGRQWRAVILTTAAKSMVQVEDLSKLRTCPIRGALEHRLTDHVTLVSLLSTLKITSSPEISQVIHKTEDLSYIPPSHSSIFHQGLDPILSNHLKFCHTQSPDKFLPSPQMTYSKTFSSVHYPYLLPQYYPNQEHYPVPEM